MSVSYYMDKNEYLSKSKKHGVYKMTLYIKMTTIYTNDAT